MFRNLSLNCTCNLAFPALLAYSYIILLKLCCRMLSLSFFFIFFLTFFFYPSVLYCNYSFDTPLSHEMNEARSSHLFSSNQRWEYSWTDNRNGTFEKIRCFCPLGLWNDPLCTISTEDGFKLRSEISIFELHRVRLIQSFPSTLQGNRVSV